MSLPKQGFNLTLGPGLDTKTDPYQVSAPSMLDIQNAIFTSNNRYIKRNGYGTLAQTPGASSLSTLNGNLVSLGTSVQNYTAATNTFNNQGALSNMALSSQNIMSQSSSITNCGMATLPNGIACVIGVSIVGASEYVIGPSLISLVDTLTGATVAPVYTLATGGTYTGPSDTPSVALLPRVCILGNYFIVTYLDIYNNLNYVAINTTTYAINAPVTIAVVNGGFGDNQYDCEVQGSTLYIAWNDTSGSIKVGTLSSALAFTTVHTIASNGACISLCTDAANVWITYSPTSFSTIGFVSPATVYSTAYNLALTLVLAPTVVGTVADLYGIVSRSAAGLNTIIVSGLLSNVDRTPLTSIATITTGGTVVAPAVLKRSVGLASKPVFAPDGTMQVLVCFESVLTTVQTTYFWINTSGAILGKLAQGNAGNYLNLIGNNVFATTINAYPQPYNYGQTTYFPYLSATSVSTGTGSNSPIVVYGYSVELATVTHAAAIKTSEAEGTLVLPGFITDLYDGTTVAELGFNIFPENFTAIQATTGGGSMAPQLYQYQVTYEWTDAVGNIHRSTPSPAISVTVSGLNNTVNLVIPTLRLTSKTSVRIVIYRWSAAQPEFHQINWIPTIQDHPADPLNDPTVDSVTFQDQRPDAAFTADPLIYTTGGVLDDSAPPAASASVVVKNRLWLLDAEDMNLLWFSKPLIEAAPIEMSDLQTIYVAPNNNSQNTGTDKLTSLGQMDDKLIIFGRNSIRYLVGNGPDSTGANSDYGDPLLVSSTVGCVNPQSIVSTPDGLVFQSAQGLWLLNRNLETSYIGAPVEQYNNANVLSGATVPSTTQVRFILDNGKQLMYDYYLQRWGTFTGTPYIAGTVYLGYHTVLDAAGNVYQETPGVYQDGANPVLMSFTPGWLKLIALQELERVHHFFLLMTYYSAHQLQITVAYDYDNTVAQTTTIVPSGSTVDQWRIFLNRQKCEAMLINIQEQFTGTYGASMGLSGLNFVGGGKLSYPKVTAAQSTT